MQCLESLVPQVQTCLGQKKGRKARNGPKKRLGVSAEAANTEDTQPAGPPKTYEKSDEVKEKLRDQTRGYTLFSGMEDEQHEAVIDAMFEVKATEGQVIIQQGDMVRRQPPSATRLYAWVQHFCEPLWPDPMHAPPARPPLLRVASKACVLFPFTNAFVAYASCHVRSLRSLSHC